MKEQLYTIPLNDAFAADDECPFCYIEQKVEQDLLDFTLGSGSSYMESDIRDMTDKAGFCRYHFQKMFQYGNTLGNAWILKTHFRKINQELDQEIKRFKPAKISFLDRMKKSKEVNNTSAISTRIPMPDIWILSSLCIRRMRLFGSVLKRVRDFVWFTSVTYVRQHVRHFLINKRKNSSLCFLV